MNKIKLICVAIILLFSTHTQTTFIYAIDSSKELERTPSIIFNIDEIGTKSFVDESGNIVEVTIEDVIYTNRAALIVSGKQITARYNKYIKFSFYIDTSSTGSPNYFTKIDSAYGSAVSVVGGDFNNKVLSIDSKTETLNSPAMVSLFANIVGFDVLNFHMTLYCEIKDARITTYFESNL